MKIKFYSNKKFNDITCTLNWIAIEFQLNLMKWNGCKLVEMILEIDIDLKHDSMSFLFRNKQNKFWIGI
jgi:hypothetical protein